jgi:hypothetical protein
MSLFSLLRASWKTVLQAVLAGIGHRFSPAAHPPGLERVPIRPILHLKDGKLVGEPSNPIRRSTMRNLCLLVTAAAVATPALAQQGQGSRPPLRILSEESVQEELQLTPAQIQLVAVEFKKMRDAQEDIQILEKDERAKAMKELIQKSDQVVAGILTPRQAKRFRQINLQLQGLRSFFSPEFAREMNVTPDQITAVKKIKEDTNAEKRELQKGAAGSLTASEARKKMAEINKKADTRIEALLMPAQKAKWQELIGKPFKGEIGFGPPGAAKPKGNR